MRINFNNFILYWREPPLVSHKFNGIGVNFLTGISYKRTFFGVTSLSGERQIISVFAGAPIFGVNINNRIFVGFCKRVK